MATRKKVNRRLKRGMTKRKVLKGGVTSALGPSYPRIGSAENIENERRDDEKLARHYETKSSLHKIHIYEMEMEFKKGAKCISKYFSKYFNETDGDAAENLRTKVVSPLGEKAYMILHVNSDREDFYDLYGSARYDTTRSYDKPFNFYFELIIMYLCKSIIEKDAYDNDKKLDYSDILNSPDYKDFVKSYGSMKLDHSIYKHKSIFAKLVTKLMHEKPSKTSILNKNDEALNFYKEASEDINKCINGKP